MKYPDFLITICMTGLFVIIAATGVILRIRGKDFAGSSPISPLVYKIGKTASFLLWLLYLLRSLFFGLYGDLFGLLFVSTGFLRWTAFVLTLIALIIILTAFINLGTALKLGLPDNEDTSLKTTGMYRFSRNPQYLAFALIDIAACLYYPHLVFIILALAAIIIHHQILIAEEKFMEEKWGDEYEEYKQKVRRYI